MPVLLCVASGAEGTRWHTGLSCKQHAIPNLVQEAEDVVLVDHVCNQFHSRPGAGLVVSFTELQEGHLIHGLDLWDVAFPGPGEASQGTVEVFLHVPGFAPHLVTETGAQNGR
eukprot:1158771-Pelagomonas_calceolata.AAC.3